MANVIPSKPIPESERQAEIIKHENTNIELPIGPNFKADLNYHNMVEFLGIKEEDRFNEDIANKISFIRDFTKEKDELDAMVKIRNIIRMLGLSMRGKELVNSLYQYTRLQKEQERLDKEMSLIIEPKHGTENREYSTTIGSVGT